MINIWVFPAVAWGLPVGGVPPVPTLSFPASSLLGTGLCILLPLTAFSVPSVRKDALGGAGLGRMVLMGEQDIPVENGLLVGGSG